MRLLKALETAPLPSKIVTLLKEFCLSYEKALRQKLSQEEIVNQLNLFIQLVQKEIDSPKAFEVYHEREPFYTRFGKDFLRPLIDMERSQVLGWNHLENIVKQVQKGDNVILFANHQTEPDPQAISLLLESKFKKFGESIIYVAGHRVTTDPLAIPFSRGCNLLCIYSKKYIETPPEEKSDKLRHNMRTIKQLRDLLKEGSKCIYVAPSGGRDRKNGAGELEVAPFDPQSVEMMILMGEQSTTHLYPLSLLTYDLLPPPESVETDLGETRVTQITPVYLNFGAEIQIEEMGEKKEMRQKQAYAIFSAVERGYQQILEALK
jgi:glycerol-3-phosphate O-acyltransferase